MVWSAIFEARAELVPKRGGLFVCHRRQEGFNSLELPRNLPCSITVTAAGGRGYRREGLQDRKLSFCSDLLWAEPHTFS